MIKLQGSSLDGKDNFEQVYTDYHEMKAKSQALVKLKWLVIETPMTQEDHIKHSEELLKKFAGLQKETTLN